jgi:hypothetical protein
MLGDPVTKPKEDGDIMGYYSRQVGSTHKLGLPVPELLTSVEGTAT